MGEYTLVRLVIDFISVPITAGVATSCFGRWTYKTDV
jgi:hypothetical protein